ncbi:hypothetical protein P3T24_006405 [Paraburkholderia sp. GAS33]|jgi:hypothetical protein|uniref:ApeA N-terminal domain 1-containing protein n=1 Tax=Paraburkholderia sp. GAS33 TaxID=3035130 RepID=UPI003D1A71BC
MAELSLSDAFQLSGEWYLPDDKSRLIPGQIHYSQERTELHLNEAFLPVSGTVRAADEVPAYSVIHGLTTKSQAVTILGAQRAGISVNFGSGGMRQSERVIASWLLIGAHVEAEATFPEVQLRIPGLQVWLSKPTVKESSEIHAETGSFSHSFRILHPPEDSIRVPSINATVKFDIRCTSTSDHFSATVTSAAWVSIRPDTPQTIGWYMEQQGKLAPLLAFLAGTPMSPDCIVAATDDPLRDVSVLVTMRDVRYCTYTNLSEFFMIRGAMDIELSTVIASWFELYARVQMPSQLALSVLASEKLWLHVEFLSLIQSLEGFHRGLYAGNYMPDSDYERVKKSLGDAIPDDIGRDHRDSLRSRIRYGNQISLRKRLDALTEILPIPIRRAILGADGKIPRAWIDTRNYYTHWDEELRVNVLDGQQQYVANVRMRHLLRALYLQRVGIPEVAILRSLFNTSSASQHLMQINAIDARRRNPDDASGVIMTVGEVGPKPEISRADGDPPQPGPVADSWLRRLFARCGSRRRSA